MKSKIEIVPEEYHIFLSYDEALFYCLILNIDGKIGWRLPTFEEWRNYKSISGWFLDRPSKLDTDSKICINVTPVRDIING